MADNTHPSFRQIIDEYPGARLIHALIETRAGMRIHTEPLGHADPAPEAADAEAPKRPHGHSIVQCQYDDPELNRHVVEALDELDDRLSDLQQHLRALIARRVAEAERERDEALAERDELAGEQAHPESLRGQWAKLRAERERMTKERDEARAEVERLKAGGCSGDFKSVAEAMLARWRERRARCLNGVAPTLAEIQAAMPSWTNEVVAQESAPRGSAMRRTIDAADRIIDMLWKHSETLRERFDYEMEQRDELRAALVKTTDERDDARAELARLRAGGCARDQRTTQFCAEAVALQRENERLRAELAAKGGS